MFLFTIAHKNDSNRCLDRSAVMYVLVYFERLRLHLTPQNGYVELTQSAASIESIAMWKMIYVETYLELCLFHWSDLRT